MSWGNHYAFLRTFGARTVHCMQHAWILPLQLQSFRDFNKYSIDQYCDSYQMYGYTLTKNVMTDVFFNGVETNKGPNISTLNEAVSVLFIFVCTIFLFIRMSDTSVSFCGLLTVLTKIVRNLFVQARHKNQSEFMVLTVWYTNVLCLFNYFSTLSCLLVAHNGLQVLPSYTLTFRCSRSELLLQIKS